MSDKEEMASDGSLNVTLTLRLLMHGKVRDRWGTDSQVSRGLQCAAMAHWSDNRM